MVASSPPPPGQQIKLQPGDPRRLSLPLAVLMLVMLGGTIGYSVVEGWPLFDSFYMVVITITTVGFGEVHSLSTAGRVITIMIIFGGIGTAALLFTEVAYMIVGNRLLARRRMERIIARLRDHYIVCGSGRMGFRVMSELQQAQKSFVIVEKDPTIVEQLRDDNIPVIPGDATDETVLGTAGIDKARGLAACLDSDANNMYLVLTAHELNSQLMITAYSHDDRANQRLVRAGATRVICPFDHAGFEMATAMTKPAVLDFIDVISRTHLDLELAEVHIGHQSPLDGQTLANTPIRKEYGIIVVAIKKTDGTLRYNPDPSSALSGEDTLVVLGPPATIPKLRDTARSPARAV